MTYLLDTSIIIALLRNDAVVVDFLSAHETDEITTSTVCVFEIMSGLYRLKPEETTRHTIDIRRVFSSFTHIVPFDQEQAEMAGKIHAALSKKGIRVGDIDGLIAAAAIATGATLVTRNTKHFSRIEGLDMQAM